VTSPLQVKCGGVWVGPVIGACGDLTYSHSWPGGSKEATWLMRATYGAHHTVLTRGKPVVIYQGGWPIWSGTMNEPDWNGSDVQLTASGLYRRAEDYLSLDGSDSLVDNPTTAGAAQITNGLPYVLSSTVPNTALAAGTSDPPNTLAALFDAHALKGGMRWMVDATGTVWFFADPTSPSFFVQRGAADLGIADDSYASNLVMRYTNTSGTYTTVVYPPRATVSAYEARYGHKEASEDMTSWGQVTAPYALNITTQLYTLTMSKPGFTNGIDVSADQLLTASGVPSDLALVGSQIGGLMVRANGINDEVALTPWTDFVVGDTTYVEGASTRTINPIGLVARTPEDVMTELLEASGRTAA
jgi:hypothetical protein